MKNLFAIALLCLLSASVAFAKAGSVEDEIKKQEESWAQATLKDGASAVEQYEADDIITTDPGGRVTDKAQDKKDYASGDMKIESEQLTDITVHSYGNVAVAAGTNVVKGTYKGQDIGGKYRFTDTWVKKNGKWQVAASNYVKVQE